MRSLKYEKNNSQTMDGQNNLYDDDVSQWFCKVLLLLLLLSTLMFTIVVINLIKRSLFSKKWNFAIF